MPMPRRAREMGPKDNKMVPKMPRGTMQSPAGHLGAARVAQIRHAFPRPIKRAGGDDAGHLPYRAPATGIDSAFGPGDKVA